MFAMLGILLTWEVFYYFLTNVASDYGAYDVYVDPSSCTHVDGSYFPRNERPTNW